MSQHHTSQEMIEAHITEAMMDAFARGAFLDAQNMNIYLGLESLHEVEIREPEQSIDVDLTKG